MDSRISLHTDTGSCNKKERKSTSKMLLEVYDKCGSVLTSICINVEVGQYQIVKACLGKYLYDPYM